MTEDFMLSSKTGPCGKRTFLGDKEKRILLVDEFDVFFNRSFYGETYVYIGESLRFVEIIELQKKARSMSLGGGDTTLILPKLCYGQWMLTRLS